MTLGRWIMQQRIRFAVWRFIRNFPRRMRRMTRALDGLSVAAMEAERGLKRLAENCATAPNSPREITK